jgi:hypothetical protein
MAELSRTRPVVRIVTGSFCLAVATALAGSGCSSGSASGGPGNGTSSGGIDTGSTDASVGCVGDPRGEKFALNMTHKGDSGMLSFVIAGSNFTPPAVEDNSWTIKVLDASGQPVKDAVVTFPADVTLPMSKTPGAHPSDPWMPDHSHGALPAKATNNMDGTYTIAPLYFFMGGIWATYIQAQVGSVTDGTTFMFCVGS